MPTLWSEEIIIRFSFPMVINRATITSILLTHTKKKTAYQIAFAGTAFKRHASETINQFCEKPFQSFSFIYRQLRTERKALINTYIMLMLPPIGCRYEEFQYFDQFRILLSKLGSEWR